MKFSYCPDCGHPLEPRDLGDDKGVPWCAQCSKPWFPMFPVAVIALVYDSRGRVLLLRQNYIHTQYRNLVSGYLLPGETAEKCAVREIAEETGQQVINLTPAGTWWFSKKEMLMIGFFAQVEDNMPLELSSEVDGAEWVPAEEAVKLVHPAGSTSHALCTRFLHY